MSYGAGHPPRISECLLAQAWWSFRAWRLLRRATRVASMCRGIAILYQGDEDFRSRWRQPQHTAGRDGSWRPEQGFSTVFGWMGSVVEARSATRIAMEQMRDAWRAEVGGTFQEKEYAPRRTTGSMNDLIID